MQYCLCVVREGYYSNVLLISCGLNKNAELISRQVEHLPCREKHPLVFFSPVDPSIKRFSHYSDGTSVLPVSVTHTTLS